MREGIDLNVIHTFHAFFFFSSKKFCDPNRTLSCRIKVILRNGGRKKEIRSVIPKVSYNSESLKLSYVQLDVLQDNCWKINPSSWCSGDQFDISLLNLCHPDCWFYLTDRGGWCTMWNRDWQSYSWVWKPWRGVMFIFCIAQYTILNCVMHTGHWRKTLFSTSLQIRFFIWHWQEECFLSWLVIFPFPVYFANTFLYIPFLLQFFFNYNVLITTI